MNLSYRLGTKDDLKGIKSLALKSWSPFQKQLTAEHWNTLYKNISSDKTYEELLNQSISLLCIADDGNIIGMGFLVLSGNPTDIYLNEWSYIRFVSVDHKYAGQGIGKNLTQMCIEKAKEKGEKIIALHTSEMMENAIHIYESLGFKILRALENRLGKRYWLYKLDI